jgi:RimJ/RimL family protein N-acetyltransferase
MAFYFAQTEKVKSGEVTIRSPEPRDIKKLQEFFPAVFNSSQYLITEPDEYAAKTEETLKENIEKSNQSESNIAILAEKDDQIVGYMDFTVRAERRRISHKGSFGMSIHPDFQGQGIGRAMLKHLILWVKTHPKIEVIHLGVLEPNTAAIELYKQMGFKQTGFDPYGVKLSDGSYLGEISMSLKVK